MFRCQNENYVNLVETIMEHQLENYKEFNIDIMHGDKHGLTAVDHLEWRIDDDMAEEEGVEKWEEFKSILEAEYAKIDLSTA